MHKNGSMVRIEDFSQDLEVDLCITQKADWDEKDVDRFTIGGEKPVPTISSNDPTYDTQEEKKDGSDIEEVELVNGGKHLIMNNDDSVDKNLKKRPAEERVDGPNGFKKIRNDSL